MARSTLRRWTQIANWFQAARFGTLRAIGAIVRHIAADGRKRETMGRAAFIFGVAGAVALHLYITIGGLL
jgi:hypothetical protein